MNEIKIVPPSIGKVLETEAHYVVVRVNEKQGVYLIAQSNDLASMANLTMSQEPLASLFVLDRRELSFRLSEGYKCTYRSLEQLVDNIK